MKRNKKGKYYRVGCNFSIQIFLYPRSSLPSTCAARLDSILVSDILSSQIKRQMRIPKHFNLCHWPQGW